MDDPPGNAKYRGLPTQTRPSGVIGQILVQGVTEVPAMSQIEAGGLDQLPFGADALEEHDELEFVEPRLHMAIEVARGNELLQRNDDRLVEATRLGGTEHGALRDNNSARKVCS